MKDLPHKACVSSLDGLHTPPVASFIRIWPESGHVWALGPEPAFYELNLLLKGSAGLPALNQVLPPLSVGILA